jgi:endonuclease-3
MLGQLGWTKNSKNPEDTRKQLESWLPRDCWQGMNLVWVGLGQEIREEKGKLVEKAVVCSDPTFALKMLRTFGVDVAKVAEKEGLELPQGDAKI